MGWLRRYFGLGQSRQDAEWDAHLERITRFVEHDTRTLNNRVQARIAHQKQVEEREARKREADDRALAEVWADPACWNPSPGSGILVPHQESCTFGSTLDLNWLNEVLGFPAEEPEYVGRHRLPGDGHYFGWARLPERCVFIIASAGLNQGYRVFRRGDKRTDYAVIADRVISR